jgi:hypothetical protein
MEEMLKVLCVEEVAEMEGGWNGRFYAVGRTDFSSCKRNEQETDVFFFERKTKRKQESFMAKGEVMQCSSAG